MADVRLTVNGAPLTVEPRAGLDLLGYLRAELGLSGAKIGCGTGNCGACTVVMDGVAVQACQVGLAAAEGADVETIERIVETELGARITESLIRAGAAQCGYCLPGIVMAAYAALHAEGAGTDLVAALRRNLCRCGTHARILRGLEEVRDMLGAGA